MLPVKDLVITIKDSANQNIVAIYNTDVNGIIDIPLPPGQYKMNIASQAIDTETGDNNLDGFDLQNVVVSNVRLVPNVVTSTSDVVDITIIEDVDTEVDVNFLEAAEDPIIATITIEQILDTSYFPKLTCTLSRVAPEAIGINFTYAYSDVSGETVTRDGQFTFFTGLSSDTSKLWPGFVAELVSKHVDLKIISITAASSSIVNTMTVQFNATPLTLGVIENIAIPAVV